MEDSRPCSICLDVPAQPAVLSCGHTFCVPCLRQYVQHNLHARQRLDLPCPSCATQRALRAPAELGSGVLRSELDSQEAALVLIPRAVSHAELNAPEVLRAAAVDTTTLERWHRCGATVVVC